MNRVSTSSNYAAVLANLQAAQQRQMQAGAQVSSQKRGDDLKSYARNAEMLTAMRSVQVRAAGHLEQNTMVADKLATQDSALGLSFGLRISVSRLSASLVQYSRYGSLSRMSPIFTSGNTTGTTRSTISSASPRHFCQSL